MEPGQFLANLTSVAFGCEVPLFFLAEVLWVSQTFQGYLDVVRQVLRHHLVMGIAKPLTDEDNIAVRFSLPGAFIIDLRRGQCR